jgi:ATP-dependent DNA helicase RecQ
MLGPAARPILRGDVPVSVKVVAERIKRGRTASATSGASLAAVAKGDVALFEALRVVRRQLAANASLPPYVIFHDSTLRAMAASRPKSLAALGRLPGVGERKLASYGAAFLVAILDAQ